MVLIGASDAPTIRLERNPVLAPVRILRRLLGRKYAPMAISALVAALCGAFADHQNAQLFEERSRAAVLSELSLVRAKLEGDINGDVQLARGVVAAIAMAPDVTQERYAELVANVLGS